MQEVSRGHSTSTAVGGRTKPVNVKKLDPNYVVGFIDGEGSFSVSVCKHATLKRRLEIRPEFEMELREDDAEILYRIHNTLGCGKVYRLEYKRYDWQPHIKLRVGRIRELSEILIPFLEQYPLQAKKRIIFKYFKEIVYLFRDKKHLTDKGYQRILALREKIRVFSKKHYRNR